MDGNLYVNKQYNLLNLYKCFIHILIHKDSITYNINMLRISFSILTFILILLIVI